MSISGRVCRLALCRPFIALCAMITIGSSQALQDEDRSRQASFRRSREEWMRSEQSPLALAGLFWLKSGANYFGTGPGNDIILPSGSTAARVGRFVLSDDRVFLEVENRSVQLKMKGRPIINNQIQSDAQGRKADVLHLNDLRLKVIQRGDRVGLRVINLRNPPLRQFSELDFFDFDPSMRVRGRFVPYQPSKKLKVALITGQVVEQECPGIVHFTLAGRELSLEPVLETPGATELFLMFKDGTNGSETYGGGRYLYAGLPVSGEIILDFNQAHNPYCAYNSYSTCSIPPRQNWLAIPIRAGEKKYRSMDNAGKQ